MREMFEESASDGFGLFLVDARNAFNSVSRAAALWNIRILWPRASRYLFNTYQGYSFMIVNGSSEFILGKEGVTQGDPLSMLMYSIAVLPLIYSLTDGSRWHQNWYADDSSCIGSFENLKEWFLNLSKRGPAFGYYPEPQKSFFVVSPNFLSEAESVFSQLGVKVVTASRFLGKFIGDQENLKMYINQKVHMWEHCIDKLATAAKHQPQAAYTAMSKCMQFEWSFLQRVVPDCSDAFSKIRKKVNDTFWPALFDGSVDENEVKLFSLPARMGGLGVRDAVESAVQAFATSRAGSECLVKAIKGLREFSIADHTEELDRSRANFQLERTHRDEALLDRVLDSVDPVKKRVIRRSVDWKTSGWLTVIPLSKHHFDLSPLEFRDALSLRYKRPLVRMLSKCDGCGISSSVQHALDCWRGGLVIQRHNEVRDSLGNICSLAYREVVKEPVVRQADESEGALIADLNVRGVWQSQVNALVDIRVADTDAPSHIERTVEAVLATSENEKRRKHSEAAEFRRATFSPFVVSVDGALSRDADHFLKRVAETLSIKWDRHYMEVVRWIRTRLSCSVVRATNLCLRGSRRKWRSGNGFEDGAGLPIDSYY